jgi:hypothetical protein
MFVFRKFYCSCQDIEKNFRVVLDIKIFLWIQSALGQNFLSLFSITVSILNNLQKYVPLREIHEASLQNFKPDLLILSK